jgi:hypothetical protein
VPANPIRKTVSGEASGFKKLSISFRGHDGTNDGAPMTDSSSRFVDADERLHAADPDDWSWNESWFFSWIDLDGGPAGFFRVGLLPNQQRAMLWSFVHVDGAWLGIEESRLAFDDFDLSQGLGYDKWALRFGWRPDPPLGGAAFSFQGTCLTRTGANAGAYVPVSLELDCRATGECVGTGDGTDIAEVTRPKDRFEQSLEATGTLVVDGTRHDIRAGAHRDRSWGPREWRIEFTIGDMQQDDRQLYFVGSPAYGVGAGYLREGPTGLRHLKWTGGTVGYDDSARTMTPGQLVFEDADGKRIEVAVAPATPSVAFDMAHTCQEPEQWLYWRGLIEAKVPGWDGPARGWFEASRYGTS